MTPKNIILIRRWFFGDVLLTTPIIRFLHKRYPEAALFFQTDCPGVLANHPLLHAPAQPVIQHNLAERWWLGTFSEANRGWHLIDILAANHFKRGTIPHDIEMYPSNEDREWAAQRVPKDAIVIGPGPGKWAGRNWPKEKWARLVEWLLPNYPVVVVGVDKQFEFAPQVHDLRRRTTEMQLAAVMACAKLFIGVDGFPLHVAGAMKTPRVGLWGVTSPDLILCNAPATNVCSDPKHPLTGARHRVKLMQEISCNAGNSPMNTISIDAVREAVGTAL